MNNGPARPGEVSAAPGSLENPIPIGPDQIHGEKWKDVAFALHYVDFVKDVHGGDLHAGLHRLPDQDKVPNAFTSMERDLLAYQFQYKMGSQATLASYCLNTKPVPVSIHLPGTIRFNSEGEWKCIQPQSTLLQANARISYTEFPKSNIRVWHVVLTPVGAFTVYDIVSLIHLYDGRSESTDVNKVTFQVNGKQYVALTVGNGSAHAATWPGLVPEMQNPPNRGGSVWVFELP